MKKKKNSYWMYGKHACLSALENPQREIKRLLTTRNNAPLFEYIRSDVKPEMVDSQVITKYVFSEAVHQGVAMEVVPLPLQDITEAADTGKPLIVLDQVTDPHNVGAILRSAAAFDAAGVIVHDRHAPRETGVMAKAASGAMDVIPLMSVHNIAQCLQELQPLWLLVRRLRWYG